MKLYKCPLKDKSALSSPVCGTKQAWDHKLLASGPFLLKNKRLVLLDEPRAFCSSWKIRTLVSEEESAQSQGKQVEQKYEKTDCWPDMTSNSQEATGNQEEKAYAVDSVFTTMEDGDFYQDC